MAQAREQAADIAQAIRQLRPDLVSETYGSRDKPGQGRKPHDEDAEAVKLTEAARAELRSQDASQTPENLYRAKCAILRRRGGPKYGSRGKD